MKRILSFSGNQDNPCCFFYFNLIASNIRKISFFYNYECFICYHFYDTFCLESDRKSISSIQKLEHRSPDNWGKKTLASYKCSKSLISKTVYIKTQIVWILLTFIFLIGPPSTYPFNRGWPCMLR